MEGSTVIIDQSDLPPESAPSQTLTMSGVNSGEHVPATSIVDDTASGNAAAAAATSVPAGDDNTTVIPSTGNNTWENLEVQTAGDMGIVQPGESKNSWAEESHDAAQSAVDNAAPAEDPFREVTGRNTRGRSHRGRGGGGFRGDGYRGRGRGRGEFRGRGDRGEYRGRGRGGGGGGGGGKYIS